MVLISNKAPHPLDTRSPQHSRPVPRQAEEAPPATPAHGPPDSDRLAVLIDADNAQSQVVGELLTEVASYGTATVKRAYGDWTPPQLGRWESFTAELQRPEQTESLRRIPVATGISTGLRTRPVPIALVTARPKPPAPAPAAWAWPSSPSKPSGSAATNRRRCGRRRLGGCF